MKIERKRTEICSWNVDHVQLGKRISLLWYDNPLSGFRCIGLVSHWETDFNNGCFARKDYAVNFDKGLNLTFGICPIVLL